MENLKRQFQASPYQGYLYSYPHKTAYRKLTPCSLGQVWEHEKKDNLFLYVHVPFCKSKCAYCNLMSFTKYDRPLTSHYIKRVLEEARQISGELGQVGISGFAVGGGTPNQIGRSGLEDLFEGLATIFSFSPEKAGTSLELSPPVESSKEILGYSRLGVRRISVGIQSFNRNERKVLGRRSSVEDIKGTLEAVKSCESQVELNVDLIYGIPGQDRDTFLNSVEQALAFEPEEIFLYPLYIRSHTHLASSTTSPLMPSLYRAARDRLAAAGYCQDSMRKFIKKANLSQHESVKNYSCQEDGMIGLGCGGRSYTRDLHYSKEYAVTPGKISDLVDTYLNNHVSQVDYGFKLDRNEQKRRYLIKSLLKADGLCFDSYKGYFSSSPLIDFESLQPLLTSSLVKLENNRLVLTEEGLELSDAIGPYLISPAVRKLMEDYTFQ